MATYLNKDEWEEVEDKEKDPVTQPTVAEKISAPTPTPIPVKPPAVKPTPRVIDLDSGDWEDVTGIPEKDMSPRTIDLNSGDWEEVDSSYVAPTKKNEEKSFLTSMHDEFNAAIEKEKSFYYDEDIPLTDKAKKFFVDTVAAPVGMALGAGVAAPFIVSELDGEEEDTTSQTLQKSFAGGVIRGATLGWVDPTPDLADTGVETIGGVSEAIGELTGIMLPFSAVGKVVGGGIKAVTGAKKTTAAGKYALQVFGDTLVGSAMGAVEKIEDNQSRTEHILKSTVLFGGLGAFGRAGLMKTAIGGAVVGGGVGAMVDPIEGSSQLETMGVYAAGGAAIGGGAGIMFKSIKGINSMFVKNTAAVESASKEAVVLSTKIQVSNAKSQSKLAHWKDPEIAAKMIFVPQGATQRHTTNKLSRMRKLVEITDKKERRLAVNQKEINNGLKSYSKELGRTQEEIKRLYTKFKGKETKPLERELNTLKKKAKKAKKVITGLQKKLFKNKKEVAEIDQIKSGKLYKDSINFKKNFGVELVSSKAVVRDPVVSEAMLKSSGISKREAGLLTAKEARRLTTKADGGNPNGFFSRVFIRPVENSLGKLSAESKVIAEKYNQLTRAAGLRNPGVIARLRNSAEYQAYKEKSSRIFDHIEGVIKPTKRKSVKGLSVGVTPEQRLAKHKGAFEGVKENIAKLSPEELELVKYQKEVYSDFIKRINIERTKHGQQAINIRSNYITHVKEMSMLQEMGINLGNADSKIMESAIHDSKSVVNNYMKARVGGDFDKDVIRSFESYLQPALRSIHFTSLGAQMEAYSGMLIASEKEGLKNLGRYYNTWLSETIYGNTSTIDKALMKAGGDQLVGMAQTLNSLTSKGAILGNISTILLQPSTFFSTVSLTGKRSLLNFVKVTKPEVSAFIAKNSREVAYREMSLEMSESMMGKVWNAVNYINKVIDVHMVKHAWLSAYEQGIKNKLSHAQASRYGDHIATTTQATYNKIFTPAITRSKITKPITQFQTFGFNLWNSLVADTANVAKHEGKKVSLVRLAKLTGAMIATNGMYDALGLPEPYEFTLPVGYSDGTVKFQPEKTSVGFMPIIGSTGRFGPSIGIRFYKTFTELVAAEDKTQALKSLKKISPLLVPAGNQMKKTTEGLFAVAAGEVKVGSSKVKIEGVAENIRAILLGPKQTVAARKYYDTRRNKKKKKKKDKKKYVRPK